MKKLQSLLEAQLLFIRLVFDNVDYILRHQQEIDKETIVLNKKPYLRTVGRLALDDSIINLYKLFHFKEQHSFKILISEVCRMKKEEDFKFTSKLEEIQYKNFLIKFNEAELIYNKMDVRSIRNKYVGHLDLSRKSIPFELKNLDSLNQKLILIYDHLSRAFFPSVTSLKFNLSLGELIEENINTKV